MLLMDIAELTTESDQGHPGNGAISCCEKPGVTNDELAALDNCMIDHQRTMVVANYHKASHNDSHDNGNRNFRLRA